MTFQRGNPAELAAPIAVLDRMQTRSLIIAAAGSVLCLIGLVIDSRQFFRSYLLAFMMWIGITLGSMAVLMLQHLSGGRWGLVIRRQLEAASRNMPLMALLFLPIALGARQVYPWANQALLQQDEALRHAVVHKAAYLNLGAFCLRAVIYFLGWIAIALTFDKWTQEEDAAPAPRADLRARFQALSGAGLLFYGLTITFASIDWVMSLDPAWSSTIYGIIFLGGQALSAMAFAIAISAILSRYEPMERIMKPEYFQDLGTMMLAFVMLWTYFSFSQFLLIWSGNLTEEIPWYLRRLRGGWQAVALMLVLFHFALPFLMLLSRDIKRHARTVSLVAVMVIAMRFLDLYWQIAPNFQETRARLSASWMDIVIPVTVGALWLAGFIRNLKQRPLLPLNDPQLTQILEPEHGRAQA